jgi:hypothetical protein
MTALEDAERALKVLEDAGMFGTGISSGFRLTTQIVRAHDAYKAALAVFSASQPIVIPMLTDRIAKYIQVDPGIYEHPNDATALALLLLVEDIFGATSSEMKALMAAADLLPSPWWTRQFIERMRVASQSGA